MSQARLRIIQIILGEARTYLLGMTTLVILLGAGYARAQTDLPGPASEKKRYRKKCARPTGGSGVGHRAP